MQFNSLVLISVFGGVVVGCVDGAPMMQPQIPEAAPVAIAAAPSSSEVAAVAPSSSSVAERKHRAPTPPGSMVALGAPVSVDEVPGSHAVVAGMASGFRRCYNEALVEDPKLEGTMRITTKIDAAGSVTAAQASGNVSSPTLARCLELRATRAEFPPPPAGSATLVIPVTFLAHARNSTIAAPANASPP